MAEHSHESAKPNRQGAGALVIALGIFALWEHEERKPGPGANPEGLEAVAFLPLLILLRGLAGVPVNGNAEAAKKNGSFPILGWV